MNKKEKTINGLVADYIKEAVMAKAKDTKKTQATIANQITLFIAKEVNKNNTEMINNINEYITKTEPIIINSGMTKKVALKLLPEEVNIIEKTYTKLGIGSMSEFIRACLTIYFDLEEELMENNNELAISINSKPNTDIIEKFIKRCEDNGQNANKILEIFMKEYISGNIELVSTVEMVEVKIEKLVLSQGANS